MRRSSQAISGSRARGGADGLGITVSYWASEEAIANWKANTEHQVAQEARQEGLVFRLHVLRVARVERAYGGAGSCTLRDPRQRLAFGAAVPRNPPVPLARVAEW